MRFSVLFTFSITLLLGSCAIVNKGSTSPDTANTSGAPLVMIARDFVGALSQLQSVLPAGATVDMQHVDRQDDFTRAMLTALQQAGYGVRWVKDEASVTLFSYRQLAENAAVDARRDTYELAFGVIEMRRGYAFDGSHRVRPVTPLYVRGADASHVVLDDSLFEQAEILAANESSVPDSQQERVSKVNAVPLKPLASRRNEPFMNAGLHNSSTLKVPSQASPLNPLVEEAVAAQPLSRPLVQLPPAENMFNLGSSNFADALAGRAVIAEQVLIFGNDSLRLGARNKELVEKMVSQFDPTADVFSVIGCSMGPTQVKGGNAALALGRAGRVVEALQFAGVDDSRILDEGCWAGDGAIDSLPRRGVVLSLNRRQ